MTFMNNLGRPNNPLGKKPFDMFGPSKKELRKQLRELEKERNEYKRLAKEREERIEEEKHLKESAQNVLKKTEETLEKREEDLKEVQEVNSIHHKEKKKQEVNLRKAEGQRDKAEAKLEKVKEERMKYAERAKEAESELEDYKKELSRIRNELNSYGKELSEIRDHLTPHVDPSNAVTDMARNAAKLLEAQKEGDTHRMNLDGGEIDQSYPFNCGYVVNIPNLGPMLREDCIVLGIAEDGKKVKIYDPSMDEVVTFNMEQVERKYKAIHEDPS